MTNFLLAAFTTVLQRVSNAFPVTVCTAGQPTVCMLGGQVRNTAYLKCIRKPIRMSVRMGLRKTMRITLDINTAQTLIRGYIRDDVAPASSQLRLPQSGHIYR